MIIDEPKAQLKTIETCISDKGFAVLETAPIIDLLKRTIQVLETLTDPKRPR